MFADDSKFRHAWEGFSGLKIMWTRLVHNIFNTDPFLMICAPFESGRCQLSNGAKIIKNGSILKKL